MVKVATAVKELPSESFSYASTTTFGNITDAFMSVLSRLNDFDGKSGAFFHKNI